MSVGGARASVRAQLGLAGVSDLADVSTAVPNDHWHPGLTNSLKALADAQWADGQHAAAVRTLQDRVRVFERLEKVDAASHSAHLAAALVDLCAYRRVEDIPLPERAGERAVSIFQRLAGISDYDALGRQPPNEMWAKLAGALLMLAHAQWMSAHRGPAVRTLLDRVKIYDRLAAVDSDQRAALATALTDVCAFRRPEDHPIPQQAGERAVAIFQELAGIRDYPTVDVLAPNQHWHSPGLGGSLYLLAHAYDLAGDRFRSALSMAKRAVVYRRLAHQDPTGFQEVSAAADDDAANRMHGAIATRAFAGHVLRGTLADPPGTPVTGTVHDAATGAGGVFVAGYLSNGRFFGADITGPALDGFAVTTPALMSPPVAGVVTALVTGVGGTSHDGFPVTGTLSPSGAPVTGTVHITGGLSADGVPVTGTVSGTTADGSTVTATATGSLGTDGHVSATVTGTTSTGAPLVGTFDGTATAPSVSPSVTPASPASTATTSPPGGSPMPELPNSTRTFLKATYDRVGLATGTAAAGLRSEPTAFEKLAFARDVAATPAEARALADEAGDGRPDLRQAAQALAAAATAPARAPQAAQLLATVGADDLIDAARRIDALRERQSASSGLEMMISRFVERRRVEPVAWLHLERVEMTPVGVERGELVATVPMAPGEKVFVSHKEWATHSSELEDIVTDELETYSEQGVAEKSDAAMSNESETKRETATNFGVSATGGYGPVTLTTSLDVKAADSERGARTASVKQSLEQTRKASARVRKEHKVSMRIETHTGTEDTAAKEIRNETGRPIRIDYYRMMRKWRVDLIRYGIRMTYDLVVPDPGASLRRVYAQILELRSKLGPFVFDVPYGDVTPANYRRLADRFGAQVDDPPGERAPLHLTISNAPGLGIGHHNVSMPIDVPDGYQIAEVEFTARVTSPPGVHFGLRILGTTYEKPEPQGDQTYPPTVLRTPAGGPYLETATGRVNVVLLLHDAETVAAELVVKIKPATAGLASWQKATWNSLFNAAQSQHYALQQDIAGRIAELEASVDRDDTLSLRRAEREEIMKRTLQWLFGPTFDVSPDWVVQAMNDASRDDTQLLLERAAWQGVREFGEFVKFLHHAVEWENILYFLYPYFWGSRTDTDPAATTPADSSQMKQFAWHPDSTRREFMRAGAARVVLPIRTGYEAEFARFMELGILEGGAGGGADVIPQPGAEPLTTPYLSIATEMQNFARTNYAGIPAANPDVKARTRPLVSVQQQKAWDDIQRLTGEVERYAAQRKAQDVPGWVGAPVEYRYYPTTAQGFQVLPAPATGPLPLTDPWGNKYRYESPGKTAPFVIYSLGARNQPGGDGEDADVSTDAEGNLIATWHEYTPTSGVDIQVDTPLTGTA
ncbi:type II secretion system protein GspG [Phytohabitans sp. LJ34]|uniref:type II secretion system protein GspG n=1 Tax=Phytohabitans sp. LJ34 TaxID=3452217 RepID=UPI003F8A86B0